MTQEKREYKLRLLSIMFIQEFFQQEPKKPTSRTSHHEIWMKTDDCFRILADVDAFSLM